MRAVLLAVAGLVASATIARADESVPPKARKLAALGRELHERGDYARAVDAFQEAYVIAPRPGLLFNLAQAYRLQGNCDDAELMYRRYLSAHPSSQERALAETHLATVVRCIERRRLNLPMDASMASLQVPPAPLADSSAAHRRARGRLVQRIGLGTSLGGLAALSVAAYYGARAHATEEDVERHYAGGTSWQEIAPLDERGQREARTARWLGIGGGATAVAGIALFLIGRQAERAVPVAIIPARRGAQIGLAWAF